LKHQGKAFKDESVELDGHEFIDCTFERCKIFYYGGPLPVLGECKFGGCQFLFEKGAGNTLDMLRGLYHSGMTDLVEATFADVRTNPPKGWEKK
jgi:hypothetical protein